jgi:hypothetical protein
MKYIDATDWSFDPETKTLKAKATYSPQAINDMLASGWAKIEDGKVVFLDAPLPADERTTHEITIDISVENP